MVALLMYPASTAMAVMTVVVPSVGSGIAVVYRAEVPVPTPGVVPSVVYQIAAPAVELLIATVVAVP